MTKCMNHPLWDIEMPLHKISHDKHYEKWGTTDKTKHKPNTLQPRIRHTRITTAPLVFKKNYGHTSENKITELQNN